LAWGLGLVFLTACRPAGVLVAETGDHRLIAHDVPSNLTVVVTSGVWDGQPSDLDREITVLHVLIANLGTEPVLLAPGDLELQDGRGFAYRLLDAGATLEPANRRGTATDGPRHLPPRYDRGRSLDFGVIRSAGGEVSQAALPWGILEPGQDRRGFLYFEPVERTANQARLVWHLGTPDHRPVVDLAFDLVVARPRPGR
jgi:hypothetical protein